MSLRDSLDNASHHTPFGIGLRMRIGVMRPSARKLRAGTDYGGFTGPLKGMGPEFV